MSTSAMPKVKVGWILVFLVFLVVGATFAFTSVTTCIAIADGLSNVDGADGCSSESYLQTNPLLALTLLAGLGWSGYQIVRK